MKKNIVSMKIFWFFYMAALGAIFPFISLYLNEYVGIDGVQLGFALAVGPLFGIVVSPLWGYIADRTGQRKKVLAIAVLGSSIGYLTVPTATNFLSLLILLGILAIFSSPAMALASSLSFGILGKTNVINFGTIRVWGTLGYLVSVVLVPLVLIFIEGSERSEISYSLKLIFPIAAALSLIAVFAIVNITNQNREIFMSSKAQDVKILLKNSAFKKLLVTAFLTFLILSSPISLFPILIIENGGNTQLIGLLWIPMLLLEVPLIFYASKGLKLLGAKNFILIGILCDGLRWLGTVYSPSLFWIFIFQLLHGLVVIGLFIGMQLYAEKEIPEKLRASAQTTLGMTMGLGSVCSYLWSGLILEYFNTSTPFLLAGFFAFFLCFFAWRLLPEQSI